MALQYSRPQAREEFEFYEQITPDPVKKPRAASKAKGRTAVRIVVYTLIAVVCIFMVLLVLASNAKLTKLSMEESELNRELAELKEEEARITVDIDKKTTLKDIEWIAVNTFGMVKVQDYQREYIDMRRSDKAEIVNSSPVSDIHSKTQTIFGGLKEYLSRDEETPAAEGEGETAAAEALPEEQPAEGQIAEEQTAEEYAPAEEEYTAPEG
ncbi:MAG: hypothetical protein IIY69_02395 [Clostridia bacterium]|nr:hypothetical protein [Clostridia bacterium]